MKTNPSGSAASKLDTSRTTADQKDQIRQLTTVQKTQLAIQAAGTGIPIRDLRQMCLRAGLEQLQRGELKVGPVLPEMLPVYLPADDVLLLREICEAADIQDGAAGFVDALLGEITRDSLRSTPRALGGVPELIVDGWILKNRASCIQAMLAVVNRWNAKKGGGL